MSEDLRPITIIRASAGTGKTFRLALEFCDSIESEDLASTVATTFTNKAAEELIRRIRKTLLNQGKWKHAQSLYASYVGTVNSVCGRLVSDLALEAGISPSVRIISDKLQSEVFNMAVEDVTNRYAGELWRLAYRMGKETEWRADVARLTELARQNNVGPTQLVQLSTNSWLELKSFLPHQAGTLRDFEVELITQITKALASLPAPGDSSQATMEVKMALAEINDLWRSTGDLPWHALVKITKLSPGFKSAKVIAKLREIARTHISLPEFHSDIKDFMHAVFHCAAECLKTYRDFKLERGLLDFIDQERVALWLLKKPEIKATLKSHFSSLFVDEFQDTSPVQLATFMELARLVNKSVWVGDEKQSIFGFRGSDPVLMQRVAELTVPLSGGKIDLLEKSYRSRPTLVNFVNEVFGSCMTGLDQNEVRIRSTKRMENRQLGSPLHVWWIDPAHPEACVAIGVQQVLGDNNHWAVEIDGQSVRQLRGSDIAVLCKTNAQRLQIASELHKLGVLVATERPGLLKTPECILTLAVLRYLNDPYDTLSMAEIVRFTDIDANGASWLHDWLAQTTEQIRTSNQHLLLLDDLRPQMIGLTPSECLQVATAIPFVIENVRRWGSPRQRFLNLDALSAIAVDYEDYCAVGRQAATAAGLLTFLNAHHKDALQPANPDENAVQVLTYHASKGLEWPLVILFGLSAPPSATPFGITSYSSASEFDPLNPLKGREVRYWPWPYGQQKNEYDLRQAIQKSHAMTEATRQRQEESIRLLYVGVTRARDYLVLTCGNSVRGADWLHMATDKEGQSVFNLQPGATGEINILWNNREVTARSKAISADAQTLEQRPVAPVRFQNRVYSEANKDNIPYSCTPSSLRLFGEIEISSIALTKEYDLGGRLRLEKGLDINLLGDALHSFLAIDDYDLPRESRLSVAGEIVGNFGLQGIAPKEFLRASERLKNRLEELYPEALWLREWPVSARIRNQRVVGVIDLLLELSEGYVVIDHKSFPGSQDKWKDQARSYFPQLETYALSVEQATGKEVIATYIHMPVIGSLVKLAPGSESAEPSQPNSADSWFVL